MDKGANMVHTTKKAKGLANNTANKDIKDAISTGGPLSVGGMTAPTVYKQQSYQTAFTERIPDSINKDDGNLEDDDTAKRI